MARVECEVEYTKDFNEDTGKMQDCVVVTCGKCGDSQMSWGHGEKSVRRCLVLLSEECVENNFYVTDE